MDIGREVSRHRTRVVVVAAEECPPPDPPARPLPAATVPAEGVGRDVRRYRAEPPFSPVPGEVVAAEEPAAGPRSPQQVGTDVDAAPTKRAVVEARA